MLARRIPVVYCVSLINKSSSAESVPLCDRGDTVKTSGLGHDHHKSINDLPIAVNCIAVGAALLLAAGDELFDLGYDGVLQHGLGGQAAVAGKVQPGGADGGGNSLADISDSLVKIYETRVTCLNVGCWCPPAGPFQTR